MRHLFSIFFFLCSALLSNYVQGQAPISQTFVFSSSIETWTVPAKVTSLTIEARGGEGGSGINSPAIYAPGKGAIITGRVTVTPGQQLSILVGRQASGFNSGGGGSFVVTGSTPVKPLVVAGGGGGGGGGSANTINLDSDSKHGQLTNNGGAGTGPDNGGGTGGTGGNGGTIGNESSSAAGGGLFTDGQDSPFYSQSGGKAFVNGGAGGFGGGFGGGGQGYYYLISFAIGGGGGGYSGGGSGGFVVDIGSGVGGGGGSFNADPTGTGQTGAQSGNSGNGLVIISYTPPCTIPTPTLTSSSTLTCARTSVTLTARGGDAGATYQFSTQSAPTSNSTISVSQAGPYSVTVTNPGGCSSVATTTVTSNTVAPENVTLSSSGTLTCTNTSVKLTATSSTPNVTYNFSGPEVTASSSNTATVNKQGTYTVKVTGANGCTASQTTTVQSNTTAPTATLSNNGPITCTQTSVTLTAGGGGTSYAFSGGASATGNTATVSNDGLYSVTVTAANGCTATQTTQVQSNTTAPSASLTSSGTITCANRSVTLTAGGEGTYGFSSGAMATGPTTATVASGGLYSVTVTGTNGCTATTSTTVESNTTAPNATLSNNGPITDNNQTVTLTAGGGQGYSFSQGATSSGNGTATVSSPGVYSVTATRSDNGCTGVASTTVAGAQNPATVCRNGTAVIRVTALGSPAKYEWYRNSLNSPRLAEITNLQRGTATSSLTLTNQQVTASYYVRVTDQNGTAVVYGPFKVTVNMGCVTALGRLAAEEGVDLKITLLGNPLIGEQLRATVQGASGKALSVQLLDLSGRSIHQQSWQQAEANQPVEWNLGGQPSGVYLLQAVTNADGFSPAQRYSLKVIKP